MSSMLHDKIRASSQDVTGHNRLANIFSWLLVVCLRQLETKPNDTVMAPSRLSCFLITSAGPGLQLCSLLLSCATPDS